MRAFPMLGRSGGRDTGLRRLRGLRERQLFVDRREEEERFEKARSVPAVLIMEWVRP